VTHLLEFISSRGVCFSLLTELQKFVVVQGFLRILLTESHEVLRGDRVRHFFVYFAADFVVLVQDRNIGFVLIYA